MTDNKKNIQKNLIWGGRFNAGPADAMARLNVSIGFDKRLAVEDICASMAHADMLAAREIISAADNDVIQTGLKKIERELKTGTFAFRDEFEDIHMNVEARLQELIGDVAGRLHTARSRNDQVATDFRLWVRDKIDGLDQALGAYQSALIDLADDHAGQLIAGMTHLQNAQPVTFGHHLLAYVEMAGRDRARLRDCRVRLNENPLGAGALAGTSFPIDRDMTTSALGFDQPMANSIDAVSDRDFALEFLSALAIAAVHLSRLAEEIIIWSSQPFSWVTLDDAFSTGSSIMPQKRNPDGAELIRAKAGRMIANLTRLLIVLKGTPMSYVKDMQEDKEAVFDAVDNFALSLGAMTGMVQTLCINSELMAAAANKGHITATDMADWLVRSLDMPFRRAHEVTGRLVAMADQKAVGLAALSLDDMQTVEPGISDEIYGVLTPLAALDSRTSYGGTAPENVKAQIKAARIKYL
jgi:argininosuccinate lyase